MSNLAQTNQFQQEGSRMLLVEGKGDWHVIKALRNKHNIPEDSFALYNCGGINNLLQKFLALLAGSDEKEVIGLIVDADDDLIQRWQQIKAILEREGYISADSPDSGGTIILADDKPKVGVWLMPDNNTTGTLETFCHRLIEEDSLTYSKEVVQSATENNIATFKDVHHDKAVIHTYLAWQDPPNMAMGSAITKEALNSNEEIATDFIQFLKQLFIDS